MNRIVRNRWLIFVCVIAVYYGYTFAQRSHPESASSPEVMATINARFPGPRPSQPDSRATWLIGLLFAFWPLHP